MEFTPTDLSLSAASGEFPMNNTFFESSIATHLLLPLTLSVALAGCGDGSSDAGGTAGAGGADTSAKGSDPAPNGSTGGTNSGSGGSDSGPSGMAGGDPGTSTPPGISKFSPMNSSSVRKKRNGY